MSTSRHERGPKTMQAEGAEVEFLGQGFPTGAAAAMAERFAKLNTPPLKPAKVKAQPLAEIPDVVSASAFAIVEDEMQDDQAAFAEIAATQPAPPPPSEPNAAAEIAWANLESVIAEARIAGFFTIITVKKLTDQFTG